MLAQGMYFKESWGLNILKAQTAKSGFDIHNALLEDM